MEKPKSKPIDIAQLLALLETHLKLDWVYQPLTAPDNTDDLKVSSEDMVAPPPEELTSLLNLALAGGISRVKQQAIQLEQREPAWEPFARRLQQLATNLEDEQIITLLEQHLSKHS